MDKYYCEDCDYTFTEDKAYKFDDGDIGCPKCFGIYYENGHIIKLK